MAKSSGPRPLSEAQLEIMEEVWGRGEATVGEIWRALSARRKVARNTVQTMVARLEEKGWLLRRDEGGTLRYSAARPRGSAVRSLVTRLVETAFHGSVSGLVMTLLEGHRLSKEEADRLREAIDRAGREKP
jgi:BlaI family transcriptional regulator, penicillinase repressor